VADTSTADVAGHLVLFDRPLKMSALKSARSRAMLERSMFLVPGRAFTNACFVLTRRTKDIRLMAGIIPAGFTQWHLEGDTVVTALYASPDASYVLRGLIKEGRLLSAAREFGYIGMPFDNVMGPAHGMRIGPPDLQRCLVPSTN
jgi:hypothetical protein